MQSKVAPPQNPTPDRKPELLAPAGNWDCARAAVENGADAIYFGLECGFNARARANNFSPDRLSELMQFLHQRNVLGYVTLNTLAFPNELPEVERIIRLLAESGVDAILVQDIGVARLARKICPDLPLHASTQMTMTSAETIVLAEQLGIERVVVARELSIDEIRDIRSQTTMPLETFVHGALCVAYSGQCLTSESLGGRSANRGQCAQACRLSYELIADGTQRDLGDQKYLLSPQDLAAFELTPELMEAGICSLKIEGRLKTPEYVASITRHYRQAIDAAYARRSAEISDQHRYEMEMTFSRGFSPGWLQGCDHKMLVPALSSAKRGVLVGKIAAIHGHRVEVESHCDVKAGDGVVFAGDRINAGEQGGRVFGVSEDRPAGTSDRHLPWPKRLQLTFGNDAIDFQQLYAGQELWKTDDPKLNQRLRRTYDVSDPVRRVALHLDVACISGQQLKLTGRADNGATCCVESNDVLQVARKHAISKEVLLEQFGRLGGTVFELVNVNATIRGNPMVPFSVLGELRKAMVNQLETSDWLPQRTIAPAGVLAGMREQLNAVSHTVATATSNPTVIDGASKTQVSVVCRTLEQVLALAETSDDVLYADFQDIREYSEAVACAHANDSKVYLATPRIQKPGEIGIFRTLERHEADGYLVRNFAGLEFFINRGNVIADFSMNCANELTAEHLISLGVDRVTASYDLNRNQLFDLVNAVPSAWLEVVIHQHMPMFHMEHCVFCAVLSPGTNKTNCGRPCDTMKVELKDRIGMEHPLTADVGCRNTLWNATPQSSAEIVEELRLRGVQHYRVELLRESPQQATETVGLYRELLGGQIHGTEVWRKLEANNRVGVTRGTLEERNPLAII